MKITVKIHPHNTAELNQLAEALKMLTFMDKKDKVEEVKEATPVIPIQQAPAANKEVGKSEPKQKPAVTAPAPAVTAPAPVVSDPAPTVTAPAPAVTAPAATGVTAEVLRGLVQSKIQEGFRTNITEYLARIGAKNVSAVDPANYQEFYDLLIALK